MDLSDASNRFRFLIRDGDATITAAFDAVFTALFTAIDIRIIRAAAAGTDSTTLAECFGGSIRLEFLYAS